MTCLRQPRLPVDLAWTIVLPIKGTDNAKSRLCASYELATAIALDTVAAAQTAAQNIIVVTDARARPTFIRLGVRVVDDLGLGLNAAVASGLAVAHGPTAVMLGDLPALVGSEVKEALQLAAAYPRAMVPDAEGSGTVLLTACNGSEHRLRFGAGSRAEHRAVGYVELDVPHSSGLRHDVDTPAQLQALASRLGPHTSSALSLEYPTGPNDLQNPRRTP